jgi:hypothetical protein
MINWDTVEMEARRWIDEHLQQYLQMDAKKDDIVVVSLNPKFNAAFRAHMKQWIVLQ